MARVPHNARMPVAELVERGEEALRTGRWTAARDAFREAIAEEERPEACAGLAEAEWWLGDTRRAIEWRERAYAGYRRHGDMRGAADMAIRLCIDFEASLGNVAASAGWLARAERLLADVEEGPLHGWIALLRANETDDVGNARRLIDRALSVARGWNDADLELCALSELGMLLVRTGDLQAGFRHLDEAMAGALAGESGQLDTAVYTGCAMLTACDLVSDLQRARQWCQAADEFTRQYGGPFLYAYCRIAYGRILVTTGHWGEAEAQLTTAVDATKDAYPGMHVRAVSGLADLRLRQGRLDEAEALIAEVDHPVATALVSAGVALRRGEPGVAVALLRRSLSSSPDDGPSTPLHAGSNEASPEAVPVLDLLVQAHLALGDADRADEAASELARLAPIEPSGLAAAHAALAAGRVMAARGDATAVECLEEALERFARLEFPLETARTRLELARASAEDAPDVAIAEARGALAAFERLGATMDADVTAALLRSWGVGGRTGPREAALLSRREREVLSLVGDGLSNQEIADRLYISRKTAAHHVSHVLSKLGVRNRAEAAAYAARNGNNEPST